MCQRKAHRPLNFRHDLVDGLACIERQRIAVRFFERGQLGLDQRLPGKCSVRVASRCRNSCGSALRYAKRTSGKPRCSSVR